jgi:hypothetical protein
MTFAKWVFTIGGIWGLLIITPLFLLEPQIVAASRPFSHPDFFYGFLASTVMWQVGYLAIARDPARYRPFMLIGATGKLIYFTACVTLFLQGRVLPMVPMLTAPDLVLATLFIVVWFRTAPKPA